MGAYNGKLCLCDWRHRKSRLLIDSRIQQALGAKFVIEESHIIDSAIIQLQEYFNRKRTSFQLPLHMIGTDFQMSVWKMLIKIPFGTTETYHHLAIKLNNPNGDRAIAAANGANSLALIVPCHRVIGMNGSLTGYAGGLDVKRKLLILEGVPQFANQLDLEFAS